MRVLVTGGWGFVGKHVAKVLHANGHTVVIPKREDLNILEPNVSVLHFPDHSITYLQTYRSIALQLLNEKIDAIVHLAGVVGGIGFNQDNQGKLGFENLQMGMNILEAARIANIKKVIILGTTCSYPHTPKTIPFIEDELFDGMPEITNSGYGIAKRTLVKLGMEYSKQYGMSIVNLIPTNMFGEHDHFEEEKSHVIPALIKKFENPLKEELIHYSSKSGSLVEDKIISSEYVNLWGTGSASRDFLYVEDCARAIAIAIDKDVGPEPINLGTGREVTIKELAKLIKQIGEYDAKIVWDPSKPDGQPRRALDSTRAKNILKWEASTPLEHALEKTIKWYRENQ